ncbi:MAG: transposase [Desulfobacteraceae bacterium]|nr:transposase [Desulfobacteraceae bacterium]MBC2754098.1 transposase [Desulfobacteraceae bacterium]
MNEFKPANGSKNLRKGRVSIVGQYYMITTAAYNKNEVFNLTGAADAVLNSLYWLDKQKRIDLQAAVVMPDHLHFVAKLNSGTLSGVMHSLKSFTSKKIKSDLNLKNNIWQSQYHDHAICGDDELTKTITYCLNNPVRANIVDDFHDYPYWYCKFEV